MELFQVISLRMLLTALIVLSVSFHVRSYVTLVTPSQKLISYSKSTEKTLSTNHGKLDIIGNNRIRLTQRKKEDYFKLWLGSKSIAVGSMKHRGILPRILISIYEGIRYIILRFVTVFKTFMETFSKNENKNAVTKTSTEEEVHHVPFHSTTNKPHTTPTTKVVRQKIIKPEENHVNDAFNVVEFQHKANSDYALRKLKEIEVLEELNASSRQNRENRRLMKENYAQRKLAEIELIEKKVSTSTTASSTLPTIETVVQTSSSTDSSTITSDVIKEAIIDNNIANNSLDNKSESDSINSNVIRDESLKSTSTSMVDTVSVIQNDVETNIDIIVNQNIEDITSQSTPSIENTNYQQQILVPADNFLTDVSGSTSKEDKTNNIEVTSSMTNTVINIINENLSGLNNTIPTSTSTETTTTVMSENQPLISSLPINSDDDIIAVNIANNNQISVEAEMNYVQTSSSLDVLPIQNNLIDNTISINKKVTKEIPKPNLFDLAKSTPYETLATLFYSPAKVIKKEEINRYSQYNKNDKNYLLTSSQQKTSFSAENPQIAVCPEDTNSLL